MRNSRPASGVRVGSLSLLVIAASLITPGLVAAAAIFGTAGPDTLEGTPDDDTINGGGGADEMSGLGGNDTYFVDNPDDVVIEGAGGGSDRIKSSVTYTLPNFVENLTLTGTAPINGTGNGLANQLIGNAANNILSGKGGADTMRGGPGNDTYFVDDPGDVVVEAVNEGIDLVKSTVNLKLRDNVEKLTLLGTNPISGTGNNLANSMLGNDAANVLAGGGGDDTLSGQGGNDRLVGGPGNDRLTGGPGNDTFQFDAALNATTNVDRITDFDPAADTMRLEGAVFSAFSAAGAISASQFALGVTANSASVRITYDPASGTVRYDPDGSGPASATRFAILNTNLAVTSADFVVVNPVAPPPIGYAAQIQPIFSGNCTGCHGNSNPPQGLTLTAGNSYGDLVNVASSEVPSLKRIKPNDPDNSYLVQKIEGTASVGARMPRGLPPLSTANINLIRQWVEQGALNN